MKPPFGYFGGKQLMAAHIAELIGEHQVYIEPFFGSGAVFFAKEPAKYEVLNDLNGDLVNFFRVLRDQPDELERVCALSPYSRAEFESCRDNLGDGDDVERARRFWVCLRQSFSGMGSSWSISLNRSVSSPQIAKKSLARFAPCAERLSDAYIENMDAVDLIDKYADRDDVVFYLDPPYLGETRRGGGGQSDYMVDMPDREAHERLLEAVCRVQGRVVLSGYASDLYDQRLRGWTRLERQSTTFVARTGADRGHRTEVLWLNYDPEPQEAGTLFEGVSV